MSMTVSHGRVMLLLHRNQPSISTAGSESFRLSETVPRRFKLMIATTATAKYKGAKMREEKLSEMIETKVKEATEVCEADEESENCKVAWDEVDEVSQARADLRIKLRLLNQDPMSVESMKIKIEREIFI